MAIERYTTNSPLGVPLTSPQQLLDWFTQSAQATVPRVVEVDRLIDRAGSALDDIAELHPISTPSTTGLNTRHVNCQAQPERGHMQRCRAGTATGIGLIVAGIFIAGCSNVLGTGDSTELTAATNSTTRIAVPAGGQLVVQGAILDKYNQVGATNGPLGLPISNEEPTPNGGRYSNFQGGRIYWTPQTGAHVVWGNIDATWRFDHGGAGGPLGYPVSDEESVPGGWRQEFQHGTVTVTDGRPQVQIADH
jgi:hypothetical protein